MTKTLRNYAMALMLGMGLVGVNTTAQAEETPTPHFSPKTGASSTAHTESISTFADIGGFSQYIFRGAAQSINNDVSIQGDVGIEHENGLSANIWFATGVDVGTGSETEFDFTVDYSGEAGDIGYSVGYIAYKYTDSTLDVNEFYLGASMGIASATAYISDTYNYIEAAAGDTVADMFDASIAVGVFSPDVGTSTTHITLGASKDYDMGSYTLSPSLTIGSVTNLDTEVAIGVNAAF